MTGLLNRRGFNSRAQQALNTASPDTLRCLILLDIDFFKKINDTWGHAIGDEVLAQLGRKMDAAAGQNDIVARVGGEEFAVMFCAKNRSCIAERIDTLQNVCSQVNVMVDDNTQVSITASLGVARALHSSLPTLYAEADRALYQAKNMGRNCAVEA